MPDTAFVSMPFGDDPESPGNEWTRLYEHGLLPLENSVHGVETYRPIKLWRADRTLASLGLKENVKGLIETCTFVIGILTTKVVDGSHGLRLSNPNVLWELGYAEAIGKPIVVLADNDSLRSLPVLAGNTNVCVYNHRLVQEARANDAAIALQKIPKDLAPFVMQASYDAQRGQRFGRRTRATAYPNRDEVNLAPMIATASEQVDILTTNLDYFLSSKFTEDGKHAFESALANGATIHIVTMDPESVITEYRAKQLNRAQDLPGYRSELRHGIVRCYEQFGGHPQFHLHIYNDLPLQITTRVDSTILTSVVTRGDRARKRIQIQFNLHDEGVTESFVTHFQSMFEDSEDVRGVAWVLRHPPILTRELQSRAAVGGQA